MTDTTSNVTALRPTVKLGYPVKQQLLDFIAQVYDEIAADKVDLESVAMTFMGYKQIAEDSTDKDEQPEMYRRSTGFSVNESLNLDYVYALASAELLRKLNE